MKIFFVFFLILLMNQKINASIDFTFGALVHGYSKIDMIGTNSVTGQTVTIEPDNQLSYKASAGVTIKSLESVFFRVAFGYLSYKTPPIRVVGAIDIGSYETEIIDAGLSVQLNLNNKLGFSLGSTYPIRVDINGPLNYQVGKESYELQGKIGYNASFGYYFDKYFHARATYIYNSTKQSNVESNLDLKGTYSHFAIELGVGL